MDLVIGVQHVALLASREAAKTCWKHPPRAFYWNQKAVEKAVMYFGKDRAQPLQTLFVPLAAGKVDMNSGGEKARKTAKDHRLDTNRRFFKAEIWV